MIDNCVSLKPNVPANEGLNGRLQIDHLFTITDFRTLEVPEKASLTIVIG